MQQDKEKISVLKTATGNVFKKLRENKKMSIYRLSNEYEIDNGTLSKLERGIYDCRISSAWKLCEANGIKFSQFAKLLEEELGEDFKFIDE